MSFAKQIEIDRNRLRGRLRSHPNDGLLLTGIKLLVRPYLWWHDGPFVFILSKLAPLADCLLGLSCSDYDTTRDSESRFRFTIDLYMILVTGLLIGCYAGAYFVAHCDARSILATLLMVVFVLLSAFRCYEILAFLTAMHSHVGYQSPAQIRAIINTIWHYCEIMLAFAVSITTKSEALQQMLDDFRVDKWDVTEAEFPELPSGDKTTLCTMSFSVTADHRRIGH